MSVMKRIPNISNPCKLDEIFCVRCFEQGTEVPMSVVATSSGYGEGGGGERYTHSIRLFVRSSRMLYFMDTCCCGIVCVRAPVCK